MKDQADKFTAELFDDKQCPVCSSLLPESKTRHFVYCKEACKKKALRAKQKASRISSGVVKPLRIPRKTRKTVLDALNPEKIVGVSGTVQRRDEKIPMPSVRVSPHRPSPVITSFDDVKAFFNGF